MGKDLKGKELGVGIVQQKNGLYMARFVDRFGKRRHRRRKAKRNRIGGRGSESNMMVH